MFSTSQQNPTSVLKSRAFKYASFLSAAQLALQSGKFAASQARTVPTISEMDLINAIKQSRKTVIFTGAGVSQASNIPTYRDADTGIWNTAKLRELGTRAGATANPQLLWTVLRYVFNNMQPNPAHHAIALLQQKLPNVSIHTQNIDGLHQQAGAANVSELHGSLHKLTCGSCSSQFSTHQLLKAQPVKAHDGGSVIPSCPTCHSKSLLPNVVFYGDRVDPNVYAKAKAEASEATLCLTMGTSGEVAPARNLVSVARDNGSTVYDVNKEPSRFSKRKIAHGYLPMRAEDFLRVAKLASGNLSQSQNTFAKKHALQRHSVS